MILIIIFGFSFTYFIKMRYIKFKLTFIVSLSTFILREIIIFLLLSFIFMNKNNLINHIDKRNRPTIAFMIRDLAIDELWKGVHQTAIEYNVNLIVLYGGHLQGIGSNIIYEFITKERFDGIITWASSDDDEFLDFYNKFPDIPIVSLALPIKNHPCISIDNTHGMKQIINHLVTVHQKKKIAFIKGPDSHVYARERYQAYIDALNENNIPFDKNLVIQGDWEAKTGIDSYYIFFQQKKLKPGRDIDAIVCIQDTISLALLDILKEKGIKVPEDIAVTGFDYTKGSICSSPSLTTVAMPFFEQGKTAVEILLKMLVNEEVSRSIILNAKSVIQCSCGCQLDTIEFGRIQPQISMSITDKRKRNNLFFYKKNSMCIKYEDFSTHDIVTKIISSIPENKIKKTSQNDLQNDEFEQMLSSLLDAFFTEKNQKTGKVFINIFNDILVKCRSKQVDFELWHYIITILRKELITYCNDIHDLLFLMDLIDQSRIMVGISQKQDLINSLIESEKHLSVLQQISSSISSSVTLKDISSILTSFLPNTQINSFYLSLYEDPLPYKFMNSPPKLSRLILASSKTKDLNIDTQNIVYQTEKILPEEILDKMKLINLFILPLLYNENQFGFLAIEN